MPRMTPPSPGPADGHHALCQQRHCGAAMLQSRNVPIMAHNLHASFLPTMFLTPTPVQIRLCSRAQKATRRLCLTVVSVRIHLPLSTSFCVLVTIIVVHILYWHLKNMLHKVSANKSYWPHQLISTDLISSSVQCSTPTYYVLHWPIAVHFWEDGMWKHTVNAVKAYSKYCTYISLWDWI